MGASMPDPLTRIPTAFEVYTGRGFRALTRVVAWLVVLLIVVVVIRIGATAWPAVQKYGPGFVVRTTWDPTRDNFGIGPQIAGTLYSAFLGLVLGTLFGLAVAIVLSQDFLPPKWEWVVRNVVQLLAAIPSVIFGLWGLFVVIPLLRPVGGQLDPQRIGLDPDLQHQAERPGIAPDGAGPGDHDSADDLGDLPGCDGGRPQPVARGRLWDGGNPLADHSPGRSPHRGAGDLRGDRPRVRPGRRGNDGRGHADRQRRGLQLVPVFTRHDPGGPAGQSFRRGQPGRDRGAHVRGLGAPGDHPGDQYHRRIHAESSIRGPGRAPRMSSSGPATLSIPETGQRPVTRLNLRRSLRSWHTLFSGGMTVLALTMSALALVPLVSVLFMVVIRGIAKLRPSVF